MLDEKKENGIYLGVTNLVMHIVLLPVRKRAGLCNRVGDHVYISESAVALSIYKLGYVGGSIPRIT